MVTASKLRAGMAIRHEGQAFKVIAADYHGGQGKMGGVAHVRLQNLATGTQTEQGFRAETRFDDLPVEKQSLNFLYSDGDNCYFMNPETFEQVGVPVAVIGPQARFLLADMRVPVEFVEGQPVSGSSPISSKSASPIRRRRPTSSRTARSKPPRSITASRFWSRSSSRAGK